MSGLLYRLIISNLLYLPVRKFGQVGKIKLLQPNTHFYMETPILENEPSNRLFKLFGFWLLWILMYIILNIMIQDTSLHSTTTAKTLSLILASMIFMGSAWMYLKQVDPKLFQGIRQGYRPRWTTTLLATGFAILEFLFLICSMYLIELYFPNFVANFRLEAAEQKEWLSFTYKDLSFPAFFLCSIIGTALVPAISEELFFRGALQSILLKKIRRVWIAIGITALMFSFMHGVFSGIVLFPLAVLYGTLYYRTKNLFITIVMHLVHNSIVGWVRYTSQNDTNTLIDDWLSAPSCCVGLVVSVALGYFCFKMLIKQSVHYSTT